MKHAVGALYRRVPLALTVDWAGACEVAAPHATVLAAWMETALQCAAVTAAERKVLDSLQSSASAESGNKTDSAQSQPSHAVGLLALSLQLHPLAPVRLAAVKRLRLCVLRQPLRWLSTLPVLLTVLNRDPEPRQRVSALHCIAQLAASNGVAAVLQVLHALIGHEGSGAVRAAGVRALVVAWQCNPRLFSKLSMVLTHVPEAAAGASTTTLEERLARALATLTVCRRSASLGAQLINVVQLALQDGASVVRTVGLKALAELCRADAVNVFVAHSVLRRLGSIQAASQAPDDAAGAAERVALAHFLATAGASTSEVLEQRFRAHDDAHAAAAAAAAGTTVDVYHTTVTKALLLVRQLWNLAEDKQASVRNAAFAALAHFPSWLVGFDAKQAASFANEASVGGGGGGGGDPRECAALSQEGAQQRLLAALEADAHNG